MQDLTEYLKELHLMKDAPHLEQLLLRLENEKNDGMTVRGLLTEVLGSICQHRRDKRTLTWTTTACFPKRFTTPFDMQLSNIPVKRVEELLVCDWIGRSENLLMCGPSGLGKTHLAVAIGKQAISKGYRTRFADVCQLFQGLSKAMLIALSVYEKKLQSLDTLDLLILDDMGNGTVPAEAGNFFYEIMNRRYDKGLSTIITTNKAVSSWGKALGDSTSVRAGLDRFLETAYKLKFAGKSLRLESFNRRNQLNIQDTEEAVSKE